MFQFLTNASVQLVNRYLPSPFVFSIVLTFIALITGIMLTGQSVLVMAGHWGEGLWSLHSFAMQMALILVTGYAFANAPIIQRFLDNMASKVTSPTMAIMVSTLIGLVGSWINWGFGLVVGAIFAKSLARKVVNVDYPLLVASAYSGFVIWHGGFSGSIPLTMSSGGDNLVKLSGGVLTEAIPLSETVFAPFNLIIVVALIVILPIVNRLMHPTNPTTVDPDVIKVEAYIPPEKNTPAQKLDDSRIVV
ncbi:TIGR00366 family protein [Psychrobacter lutiphocae]|uniref:TIGR00366 family protein n=1 Tax=Psychrobacter lutiphocae TaxID=540500 RepID=UPI00035F0A21|nr:TIGR00366 family protein [Psychrobacter lutiphocae]